MVVKVDFLRLWVMAEACSRSWEIMGDGRGEKGPLGQLRTVVMVGVGTEKESVGKETLTIEFLL